MGESGRAGQVKGERKIDKSKEGKDKDKLRTINGFRTGLDVSPDHSNRLGMKVKLSWHSGIKCCINCTKNISDNIIVGSGQSRLLTGTGITIEGNCLYTMGHSGIKCCINCTKIFQIIL